MALEESKGHVELPSGVVSLDTALALTGNHSGMVFDGDGTTLRCVNPWGDYIGRGALSVRDTAAYSFYEARPAGPLPADQVGWLFSPTGANWKQGPIQRFLPGETVPPASETDQRAFMRGFRAVPFDAIGAGAANLKTPNGHPFGVGETVLLTDGPLINELRVEYRRIKSTTATGIELDAKLVKGYSAGAIVGGDWPHSITFRGLTFAGDMGPVFLGPAVELRFENCTFARNAQFPGHNGWLSISGCARCSFVRCKIDCGMTITSSHDIHFRECTVPLVVCEQGVSRVTFDGGMIGDPTAGVPDYFDARIQTTDMTIRRVTFTTKGLGFYDDYQVSDCRIIGPGECHVRGYRCSLRNVVSDRLIHVQRVYEGWTPNAGRQVRLENLTAPAIHLDAGTSGTIRNCVAAITGDKAKWTIS